MALGYDIPDAVERACRFVEIAIKTAPNLGKGSGPINHFHSVALQETVKGSLRREDWTKRAASGAPVD